jgi:hypothetical protein
MAQTDAPTKAQINRDDLLRQIARDPGEALRQWKRLNGGEQTVVVTYMALYYDLDFAKHFMTEANKRTRPDLVITITNDKNLTPDKLRAKGFVYQRTFGNTQVWVEPGGSEVWLQPPAKAAEPPPSAPPNARPHPDVEEVQLYVKQYSARKADLFRRGYDLAHRKGQLSPAEYARQKEAWQKEMDQMTNELNELLTKTIPSQTGTLTPQEQAEKQKAIDRLKKINDIDEDEPLL